MWFEPADFISFWHSPWSQPLRSACGSLSRQARQMAQPEWKAPRWLRPLCLQRWIGQAIAERLAWLAEHPDATPYRFVDSMPCWSKTAALPYEGRRLHKLEEIDLFWLWEVDVERLQRIAQADPIDVGEDRWTQAMMGVCGHLAQGYKEFKRRYGARRARSLLREVLWLSVTGGRDEED